MQFIMGAGKSSSGDIVNIWLASLTPDNVLLKELTLEIKHF